MSTHGVAAQSKAWVYGLSLAEIVGSNPAGNMDVCNLEVRHPRYVVE